jgi:hypothetical protein
MSEHDHGRRLMPGLEGYVTDERLAGGRAVGPVTYEAPKTIRQMLFATWALLNSFTADQRGQAVVPLEDPRWLDWDFIPKPDRLGVPLFQMDRHQRRVAMTLLKTGLSMKGYTQALAIMATENVLRELEAVPRSFGVVAGDFRDPEGYWFGLYGRPAFEDTWGWRVIGHHLSLSYTIVRQQLLTVTPLAMGAQPYPAWQLNPLGENQEAAFALLASLRGEQRRRAVIHDTAPADFVTRQIPRVGALELPDYVDLGIPTYKIGDADRAALRFEKAAPSGITGAEMGAAELTQAKELLLRFVESAPEEIAVQYRAQVEAERPENVVFAWAGGTERDVPHYYRVSTRDLLVESDNAVASGEHVHAVWRDLRNDLGHELLLDHYERYGHGASHLERRLSSSEGKSDPALDHVHGHDHGHGHREGEA